jgi:hypothetical protein
VAYLLAADGAIVASLAAAGSAAAAAAEGRDGASFARAARQQLAATCSAAVLSAERVDEVRRVVDSAPRAAHHSLAPDCRADSQEAAAS